MGSRLLIQQLRVDHLAELATHLRCPEVYEHIGGVPSLQDFSPNQWGKGLALEALDWLHAEIRDTHNISSFWATTVPENTRCESLLLRSGYRPAQAGQPVLYSFDPGDLVFHLDSAAQPIIPATPFGAAWLEASGS